ncbi:phosphotransferase family protein [Rhodobacterales bacterium]|nr:phosphotransferase family protein [Rhodobacterales bacterium]
MPQKVSDTPDISHAAVLAAFADDAELARICGTPDTIISRDGLTNRVFRIEADNGDFFLRLPGNGSVETIDREAEAHNLEIAASLGLAVPPLVCRPETGLLLTRDVKERVSDRTKLAVALGHSVARLHGSGAVFQGKLDPDDVCAAEFSRLEGDETLADAARPLLDAIARAGGQADLRAKTVWVPSHGDLSEGNCLMTGERLWLIDWEYSAMAEPAWDLAYAIQEIGFTTAQEHQFLTAYGQAAGDLPSARQMNFMKARCDAVSALWAFGQMAQGRDQSVFLSFARQRRDRALGLLASIT